MKSRMSLASLLWPLDVKQQRAAGGPHSHAHLTRPEPVIPVDEDFGRRSEIPLREFCQGGWLRAS